MKNDNVAPSVAPKNTVAVPMKIPNPMSFVAAVNAIPAPMVRILPGINATVQNA